MGLFLPYLGGANDGKQHFHGLRSPACRAVSVEDVNAVANLVLWLVYDRHVHN